MPSRSGYLLFSFGTLLICLLVILYIKQSQITMMEEHISFLRENNNHAPVKTPAYDRNNRAPLQTPVYDPNKRIPVKTPTYDPNNPVPVYNVKQNLYDPNITLDGLRIEEIKKRAVKGNIHNYLADYKNPCWFESNTSRSGIRCLPHFYQLGVAKSGSSSLWWNLMRHPQIIMHGKELNYWQYRGIKSWSLDIYLNKLQNSSFDIYDRMKPETGYHDVVTFDATPLLISMGQPVHPDNINSQQEPIYTLAHTLYTLNPKTLLIVTMRDPTDRLFSDFHHFHRENISQNDFHDWSKRGVDMMNKCLEQRTLRSCAFDQALLNDINCVDRDFQRGVARFQLSMYYPFVKEFLSVFPRKQMYLVKAEEMYSEPSKVMPEVFRFLQLEEPSEEVMTPIIHLMNSRFSDNINLEENGESYRTLMMHQTEAMLDAFFAPYNQQLAELLQDNKWLFK